MDEYKRKHDLVVNASQTSSSSFQSEVSTCARKWLMAKDRLQGFDAYVSSTTDFESVRSEMDNYLGELLLPKSNDFDLLAWWKINSNKYPILQAVARDVLAIPISTVASESAFSTSGRFISSYRSRLHPKTLEAMMCTQDWLWVDIHGIRNLFDCVIFIIFYNLFLFVN